MDFSGELADIQQQLALSHDMDVRRAKTIEALRPQPGELILEVGCGSGLYLREIGTAVGPTGFVLGIDISEDQIRVARSHCADLSQVQLLVGDLLALPAPERLFDATVSVQVLEYITEVDQAVERLALVTRPGGRFVNVATNWGALFWSGGDPALTARVLAIWE